MKKYLIFTALFVLLSSCFKNEPTKEMTKAAGPWEIEEAQLITYNLDGSISSTQSAENIGFLHLYYNDKFLNQGTFNQTLNKSFSQWNSNFKKSCTTSSIWWISVHGKTFGFGTFDPSTSFVGTNKIVTLSKFTKNKMELVSIEKDAQENLLSMETWKLKRYK